MVAIFFYCLSIVSLLIGAAAIYMPFIPAFPISWLYYHYFVRKYLVWAIFLFTAGYDYFFYYPNTFDFAGPIGVMVVSVILAYRAHQEQVFKTINFPECTEDLGNLPIPDEADVALVRLNGVTKCYKVLPFRLRYSSPYH